MSTETKEVFVILRAIAEELLHLFLEWFRSRPRLASASAVLGVAIGSLVCLKLLFWLLWSPAATPLGSVSGTVTLNSRPLERATIEFTPASGGPSYGITDRRGRYELEYLPGKPGATLGEHVVRITTYDWITRGERYKTRDSRGCARAVQQSLNAYHDDQTRFSAG